MQHCNRAPVKTEDVRDEGTVVWTSPGNWCTCLSKHTVNLPCSCGVRAFFFRAHYRSRFFQQSELEFANNSPVVFPQTAGGGEAKTEERLVQTAEA